MFVSLTFQSTHPCGVRQTQTLNNTKSIEFQSTHPCGVRHLRQPYKHGLLCFNPRTRVGCDFAGVTGGTVAPGFNPRTRVGCDEQYKRTQELYQVSIHAPVWGATPCIAYFSIRIGFNPRTRVGCDVVRK